MRSAPKKELKTDEEARSCDVCGRTILKGERTEPYLAPGGRRKLVCELCTARADHEGWIREAAHGDVPAARARPSQRRSLVGRVREMLGGDRQPGDGSLGLDGDEQVEERPAFDDAPRQEPTAPPPRPQRRRNSRHIRAVPTTREVKIERALELFNASAHPRTISGIARTLGTPFVHASPDGEAPSQVTIVVAWELSWYRYKVDLGDEHEPIALLEKGDELGELEQEFQSWNAAADEAGRLSADVGSAP